MMKSAAFLSLAVAAAIVSTAANAHAQEKNGKEKCFGVVKAGKNDCASASGSHGCAGLAKKDGDADEWILLPKGACERLAGGTLEKKTN